MWACSADRLKRPRNGMVTFVGMVALALVSVFLDFRKSQHWPVWATVAGMATGLPRLASPGLHLSFSPEAAEPGCLTC